MLEATGVADVIKSGVNSFMEDIPWLMKSLDQVAKVHPFLQSVCALHKLVTSTDTLAIVVVLAFKAAYTMELTRRNNDKRITTLYLSMKDMISVLVQ